MNSILLLSPTLLAVLAVPGLAQGEGPRDHRPPPPLVEALDKDHDGALSKREIARAPRALAQLDKNNDGELTREELHPPRPEGEGERPPHGAGPPRGERPPRDDQDSASEERPERRPPPPLARALDANEDGVLSEKEIENASEALSELDHNNDGEITREELHPPHPDGDEAGPPDGPPPGAEEGGRRGPPPGEPRAGRPPRR